LLLLAITGSSIAAAPFTSIRYILPLEIKLGEYYLQSSSKDQTLPSAYLAEKAIVEQSIFHSTMFVTKGTTSPNQSQTPKPTELSLLPLLPARNVENSLFDKSWGGPTHLQTSFMNFTYLYRNSFVAVDVRHDIQQITGSADELRLGTAVSYGHYVAPALALFFGVKTAGFVDAPHVNSLVVDYGKVFLTPGLQLRSRSVVIETFLEMPVYAYDQKTRQSEFIVPNDVRANIGIRYQH